MDKRENDDLIVEVSDDQLALKLDTEENQEIVAEPEIDKPGKKADVVDNNNDDAVETLRAQIARLERERDENARQAAEERRQKLEAQQDAQRRAKEVEEASGRASSNELGMVGGYIAAAKSKQAEIRQKIRSAVESGDVDGAEDLRMEAARVAARLIQYEDHKADLEARAERAKVEPKVEPKREPIRQNIDPVDAIEGVSDTSKAWLRQHPECVTNPGKNAKLLYGHHQAIEKGIRPDTPEYFEHLDIHMGFKQAQTEDEGDDVPAPKQSERRSMPSAPVSRDNGRTGQIAPGKYRLSREEADMAESLNMTPTEYATWKIKAEKEGRYQSHH